MKNSQTVVDRIYSLDALRGIAALCVVFWHWQHFFPSESFQTSNQPLFGLFKTIYTQGSLAVELFFCISGFIFFWLYSKSIEEKKISPWRFFLDRFSRLYPLHLMTFALVILLQSIYSTRNDNYFVYPINDAFHAILNFLLIPAWGLEKGWSFNAPIWSVSIEVLLYIIFFIICRFKATRFFGPPALIFLGTQLFQENYKISIGLFAFFSGGCAYLLLDLLLKLNNLKISGAVCLIGTTVSWAIYFATPEPSLYFIMGIGFPSLIMSLFILNLALPNLFKPTRRIGDLSYSSYLLHFPLQIILVLITDFFGYERTIYYSPWMLILFFILLIPVSLASHSLFEIPAQRTIRRLTAPKSLLQLK